MSTEEQIQTWGSPVAHLITYHSIEQAEAAINLMKLKTIPRGSSKENLIVRKIIYEIQGD